MKSIYITLIALCLPFALLAQTPCKKTLDEYDTPLKLDPVVLFDTLTDVNYTDITHIDPNSPDTASDSSLKVISWVHGMNGNDASWVRASGYADSEYFIKSLLVDYSNFQQDVSTLGIGLQQYVDNHWPNYIDEEGASNSFAIAHSLGGITTRIASEKYAILDDKINGLVTVTSPHGGSNLAYYIDTYAGPGDPEKVKDMKKFAAESCEAFGAGPVKEKLLATGLTFLENIGFLDFDDIIGELCQTISDVAIPVVIDQIAPQAVSELTPNAEVLDLHENIPNDHKMLFTSSIIDTSTYDMHNSAFKMFYSGKNNPTNRPLWGADSMHYEAIDTLNKQRDWYNNKYQQYYDLYDNKPILVFNWQCAVAEGFNNCTFTYGEVKDIRDGYRKALGQFRKVNDYWEVITGARQYNIETGFCFGASVINGIEDVTYEQCQNLYANPTWIQTGLASKVYPYDGLLTVDSQEAWSTCPEDRKYHLEDSDHLQIKNDLNTKKLVDFTLKGEGANFFRTVERE